MLLLSNMFCEYLHHDGVGNHAFVIEIVRRNSLDRVAQAYELSFPFGGSRSFSTCEVIHGGAADMADHSGRISRHHRKFKSHPVDVVANYPAPHKRHRNSISSGGSKMMLYRIGFVESAGTRAPYSRSQPSADTAARKVRQA